MEARDVGCSSFLRRDCVLLTTSDDDDDDDETGDTLPVPPAGTLVAVAMPDSDSEDDNVVGDDDDDAVIVVGSISNVYDPAPGTTTPLALVKISELNTMLLPLDSSAFESVDLRTNVATLTNRFVPLAFSDAHMAEIIAQFAEAEVLVPWLTREMWTFHKAMLAESMATLTSRAQKAARVRDETISDADATWRWTQRAIVDANRPELADALRRCGGASAMAIRAGFRVVRKPAGYWDLPENLDIEIERYVHGQWLELEDEDDVSEDDDAPASTYWYNPALRAVRLTEPAPWNNVLEVLREQHRLALEREIAQDTTATGASYASRSHVMYWDSIGAWREKRRRVRIMPKVHDVITDGRLDLKNAIYRHGGMQRVANSLGRTAVLTVPERLRASREYLRSELRPYLLQDGDVLRVPLMKDLRLEGRSDLASAIERAGGAVEVAQSFSAKGNANTVAPSRVSRNSWRNEKYAAEEMKRWIRESLGDEQPKRLPTRNELKSAGAWGLRYALSLHGSTRMAELIGVPLDAVRGRGKFFIFGNHLTNPRRIGYNIH